jgi:hypothetical protein
LADLISEKFDVVMGLSSYKRVYLLCCLKEWSAGYGNIYEQQNPPLDAHGAALQSCTNYYSNRFFGRTVAPLEKNNA